MIAITVENLRQVDRQIYILPDQIKSLIFMQVFNHFAYGCYYLIHQNETLFNRRREVLTPNIINLIKQYSYNCNLSQEEICKYILINYNYTVGLDFWQGRYSYLVNKLIRLTNVLSKYSYYRIIVDINEKNKFKDQLKYTKDQLSEDESNEFPDDVIDFIYMNTLRYDNNQIELFQRAYETRNQTELIRIINNYFIPQHLKDTIALRCIQNFNETRNSLELGILNLLCNFGANYYKVIRELIEYRHFRDRLLHIFTKSRSTARYSIKLAKIINDLPFIRVIMRTPYNLM